MYVKVKRRGMFLVMKANQSSEHLFLYIFFSKSLALTHLTVEFVFLYFLYLYLYIFQLSCTHPSDRRVIAVEPKSQCGTISGTRALTQKLFVFVFVFVFEER